MGKLNESRLRGEELFDFEGEGKLGLNGDPRSDSEVEATDSESEVFSSIAQTS